MLKTGHEFMCSDCGKGNLEMHFKPERTWRTNHYKHLAVDEMKLSTLPVLRITQEYSQYEQNPQLVEITTKESKDA